MMEMMRRNVYRVDVKGVTAISLPGGRFFATNVTVIPPALKGVLNGLQYSVITASKEDPYPDWLNNLMGSADLTPGILCGLSQLTKEDGFSTVSRYYIVDAHLPLWTNFKAVGADPVKLVLPSVPFPSRNQIEILREVGASERRLRVAIRFGGKEFVKKYIEDRGIVTIQGCSYERNVDWYVVEFSERYREDAMMAYLEACAKLENAGR